MTNKGTMCNVYIPQAACCMHSTSTLEHSELPLCYINYDSVAVTPLCLQYKQRTMCACPVSHLPQSVVRLEDGACTDQPKSAIFKSPCIKEMRRDAKAF